MSQGEVSKAIGAALLVVLALGLVALASCETLVSGPSDPQAALIAKGHGKFEPCKRLYGCLWLTPAVPSMLPL